MNPLFKDIAACPACGGELLWQSRSIICQDCEQRYPIINGVPVLRLDPGSGIALAVMPRRTTTWKQRLSRRLSVPGFSYKTEQSRGRIPAFVASLDPEAIALNLGSGQTSFGPRVINLDIGPFPNVDAVGSGESLPVQDASLDAVITQGVLEHVPNLRATLGEIDRALRPGGQVYHEVPFIQGYHGSPGDFRRFTVQGIAELAPDYQIVEQGVAVGPSSALGWLFSEWLALLFSFGNDRLHKLGRRVFGWLLSPVKHLDRWLESRPQAELVACAFYIIARKPAP